jgi:hypothetical protein
LMVKLAVTSPWKKVPGGYPLNTDARWATRDGLKLFEHRKLLPLPVIEPRFLSLPAQDLLTISTRLSAHLWQ